MNTYFVLTRNTPSARGNGLTPIWSNATYMAFIVQVDPTTSDGPNLPDQLSTVLLD